MLNNNQMIEMFRRSMDNDFIRLAERTIENNMDAVTRFVDSIGEKNLMDVNRSDIENYMIHMTKKDGSEMNIDTKQLHLSAIKKLFKFLYNSDDQNLIGMKYVKLLDGSSVPKQCPVTDMPSINANKTAKLEKNQPRMALSEHEISLFLSYFKYKFDHEQENGKAKSSLVVAARNFAMVKLMLETGLRVSDICALDVSNFDLETNTLFLTIKKIKQSVNFKITKSTMDRIKYYWGIRDICDYAFCSLNNERMTTDLINKMLKSAAKKSGLDPKQVSAHILRKTCGSILYQETQDIIFVKNVLCHSTITTTQRYLESKEIGQEARNNSSKIIEKVMTK